MRIALVTLGDPSTNPRCRPLVAILELAGHDVSVVSPPVPDALTDAHHIQATPTRLERTKARLGGTDPRLAAVARVADDIDPEVVYPLRERDLVATEHMASGRILSRPGWKQPVVRDFVWATQAQQGIEPIVTDASSPTSGGTVNIVARFTATTPARYLESAFERIGFDVVRWDGGIDWNAVSVDSTLTVFVESPYPALSVEGTAPDGVPVLFWVHHGEHHQAANLRLADRYGADAVMMAHSWHLAHQYRQPVFALPFGVPTDLIASDASFADRPYDVAMVGAGLEATDGWYARRGSRVRGLRDRTDLRSIFAYGLQPAEMLELYGESKIVINDGGRQHHPITMRIFETFGAGAALATEPAPGLQAMFTPGEDFALLHTADGDEVAAILESPDLERMAHDARRKALAAHTYDHRARDVVAIAQSMRRRSPMVGHPSPVLDSELVACVRDDVDVQTILVAGHVEGWRSDASSALADRDIRVADVQSDIPKASFDAVVVGSGADPTVAAAARFYVYVSNAHEDVDRIARLLPSWQRTDRHGVARFDSRSGGYRVRSEDHPLR